MIEEYEAGFGDDGNMGGTRVIGIETAV